MSNYVILNWLKKLLVPTWMSEASSVQLHITASVSTVTTSSVHRALAPRVQVSPFPFQIILQYKVKNQS